MKRVFFALNLPSDLKKELGGLITELTWQHQKRTINWVTDENLHITLHFLGNRNDDEITKLDAVAREVAKEIKPFSLTTDGVGCFPNAERPRVIFLETHNGGVPQTLVHKLSERILGLGFDIDLRPWHAHLTLGRVKDNGGACNLLGVTFPPHTFDVKSFELMESEIGHGGPTYMVRASYILKDET